MMSASGDSGGKVGSLQLTLCACVLRLCVWVLTADAEYFLDVNSRSEASSLRNQMSQSRIISHHTLTLKTVQAGRLDAAMHHIDCQRTIQVTKQSNPDAKIQKSEKSVECKGESPPSSKLGCDVNDHASPSLRQQLLQGPRDPVHAKGICRKLAFPALCRHLASSYEL